MSAKPVVIAFAAGVGLTVAVLAGVWNRGESPRPSPASEAVALAESDDPRIAVVETEATLENISTPESTIERPRPTQAVPVVEAPPRGTEVEPRLAAASPRRTSSPSTPSAVESKPTPVEAVGGTDDALDVADAVAVESSPQLSPPAWAFDDEPEALEPGAAFTESSLNTWEPPPPIFEDLVIAEDSVISLEIETSISTDSARVEDRVVARTIRDVRAGQETAIPAGARAIGSVILVELGGKMREQARLGVRFHTIELGDGSEVPIETETIYREGRSPANGTTARIGGAATAGAILGAIFGGRKGAVIGGAAGAAGGTAAAMARDREPATLPAGTTVTIRLTDSTTVTVER